MVWDTTRAFPPARACLFCYGLTGVTFLGDPSAGSGLPRGTMVYANMPIPLQVTFLSFDLMYEGDSICNEIALITPPTHGLELYTIYGMKHQAFTF